MKRLTGLVLSVTAALCVTGCPGEYGDDQLHVKDGAIYRESHDATLRAVTLADLGQPGFERVATLERINQAAAAGASAVCFDLYGLGAEGEELDQAVAAYTELVGLLTHQSVMGVCRVFGRHPGADDAWRKEKLTQFAKRIPERYEVIYWLEGEDPAELAAALDEAAPQLLAAASEGGDVTTLPLGQDARGPGPFLHIDALPTSQDAHFVLTGGEDDFAKLETYAAMRGEKLPWEPSRVYCTEEERREGWVCLSDGTLNAWVLTGDNQDGWQLVDGAIVRVEEGGGYLRTKRRYSDFILRLEYRIPAGGNSGIHLRAPRAGRSSRIGFEFQILGDHGREPARNSTGAIYGVRAPRVNASKPSGEWNRVEIRCDGSRVTATLNGETVQDVDFSQDPELAHRLREGFIMLQDHGNRVAYRNVRLKEL